MDHLTIYQTKNPTTVSLHEHYMSLPHVYMQIFSFCYNFPNVLSRWGNNVLYLTPVLNITIPDGLYTNTTINNTVLGVAQADTKFYSISVSSNGLHYEIYQFNSYSDKLNNINGIPQTGVYNLSLANQELYSGVWFSDRIKLRADMFEVHANDPNYPETQTVYTTNEIIIPVSVEPMQVQAYHFNSKYGFHNKNNNMVNFTLLDMKNRVIQINELSNSYPTINMRYEEADY